MGQLRKVSQPARETAHSFKGLVGSNSNNTHENPSGMGLALWTRTAVARLNVSAFVCGSRNLITGSKTLILHARQNHHTRPPA